MSDSLLGAYSKPQPQFDRRIKGGYINPRSFIPGGVNKGMPPYLLTMDQWLDSQNMVFDFDRAKAIPARKVVDILVATPTGGVLQLVNTQLPTVPLPDVPRSGQNADFNNRAYPGVPVYDHSRGPDPEPDFNPLDPFGYSDVPRVSDGIITVKFNYPISYQIIASSSPTSYAAIGLPPGLSIDTATGLITGTISEASLKTYNIPISATNKQGTGTATLTIKVQAYLLISIGGNPDGVTSPADQLEVAIDNGPWVTANDGDSYQATTNIALRIVGQGSNPGGNFGASTRVFQLDNTTGFAVKVLGTASLYMSFTENGSTDWEVAGGGPLDLVAESNGKTSPRTIDLESDPSDPFATFDPANAPSMTQTGQLSVVYADTGGVASNVQVSMILVYNLSS